MALISHWKLDGDATDSVGGHTLTAVNSGGYTTGKIGQSLNVTNGGGATRVSLSSLGINALNGSWSITLWAKPNYDLWNTLADRFPLFEIGNYYIAGQTSITWSRHTSVAGGRTLVLQTYDNQIAKNGFARTFTVDELSDWFFFSLTFDGTNLSMYSMPVKTGTIYYNTCVKNWSSPFADNIFLGGYGWDVDGWRSLIDDVRIYNHALSQKEVKELSRAKVLHYDFDDFQEPTTNVWNQKYEWNTPADGSSLAIAYLVAATPGNYTVSADFLFYPDDGTTSPRLSIYARDAADVVLASTSNTTVVKDGLWYKRSASLVAPANTTKITGWILDHSGVVGSKHSSVKNIQLEQKDHATPFVNGSRTGQVKDISGYDNHSVALAEATTPQWVAGKLGSGGYYFDGTDRYIKSSISSSYLASLTTCSISFWRKHTALASWLPFMGQTNSHYIMATSGGTGAFYHGGVGANTKTIYVDGVVSTTPSTDLVNWHHYVITGLDLTAWTEFYLGHYPGEWLLEGSFDDIRIYNTNLSVDDVKELYQTRAQIDTAGNFYSIELEEPPVTDGLVGWWKMDGDATDSSGYENDGTVNGATLTTGIRGVANTAYSFDGASNKIVVFPNDVALTTYTATGWFYRTDVTGTYGTILGNVAGGSAFELESIIPGGGTTNLQAYPSTVLKTTYSLNQWHFFTLIRTLSTQSLYLDGALIGSEAPMLRTVINTLQIGSWNGSQFFKGKIDDVRIYNKALTQSEITLLYNLGLGIYE